MAAATRCGLSVCEYVIYDTALFRSRALFGPGVASSGSVAVCDIDVRLGPVARSRCASGGWLRRLGAPPAPCAALVSRYETVGYIGRGALLPPPTKGPDRTLRASRTLNTRALGSAGAPRRAAADSHTPDPRGDAISPRMAASATAEPAPRHPSAGCRTTPRRLRCACGCSPR